MNLRRRILAGDRSAWEELYVDCFDSLWIAVARKVGPDRGRIEDVVQETWLVAVRRIRQFDPERGCFRGWLHGIADRVGRNAGRKWARERRVERTLTPDEKGKPEPAQEVQTAVEASLENEELLEVSFASLPAHYRLILRSKYVEDLSVTEIASRQGVTPKAIESLLGRARRAFRDVYQAFSGPPKTHD